MSVSDDLRLAAYGAKTIGVGPPPEGGPLARPDESMSCGNATQDDLSVGASPRIRRVQCRWAAGRGLGDQHARFQICPRAFARMHHRSWAGPSSGRSRVRTCPNVGEWDWNWDPGRRSRCELCARVGSEDLWELRVGTAGDGCV